MLTCKIMFPVDTNRKAKQINNKNIPRFSLQPSNFVEEILHCRIDLPQQDDGMEITQSL